MSYDQPAPEACAAPQPPICYIVTIGDLTMMAIPVPPPAAPPAGWTRIRYVGEQQGTRYAPHHTDESSTPETALAELMKRYLNVSRLLCIAYYPAKDETGEWEREEVLASAYEDGVWSDWK